MVNPTLSTVRRRVLAIAAALLALVGIAALPATAASSSNTYTANWSPNPPPTLVAGTSQQLSLMLANTSTAPQSFGSAQINLGAMPASLSGTDGVTGPAGTTFTETVVSTNPWIVQVTSPNNTPGVAPGTSMTVTFHVTPTTPGTFSVGTQVKQSNNFNGPNNQFAWTNPPLQLTVVQQCTTVGGSCSSGTQTDGNGVSGTVTFTSSASTVQFVTTFTGQDLNCDSAVIGTNTKLADELYVDASASTGGAAAAISKTITLTFPKKVVDAVPNNGTNQMPVCAVSDFPFPGWSPAYSIPLGSNTPTTYEGLLFFCSDPTYQADLTSSNFTIFPCIQSETKTGLQGGESVVIFFPSNTNDYSGWF